MSRIAPLSELPLFAPTPIQTMVRSDDPSTCWRSAEAAKSGSVKLKERVFQAFKDFGSMTDGELEKLDRFQGECINSIRKRRTDLSREGKLQYAGYTRGHPDRPQSMMMVWTLAEDAK